jgi:hypothetical protein
MLPPTLRVVVHVTTGPGAPMTPSGAGALGVVDGGEPGVDVLPPDGALAGRWTFEGGFRQWVRGFLHFVWGLHGGGHGWQVVFLWPLGLGLALGADLMCAENTTGARRVWVVFLVGFRFFLTDGFTHAGLFFVVVFFFVFCWLGVTSALVLVETSLSVPPDREAGALCSLLVADALAGPAASTKTAIAVSGTRIGAWAYPILLIPWHALQCSSFLGTRNAMPSPRAWQRPPRPDGDDRVARLPTSPKWGHTGSHGPMLPR